MNLNLTPLVSDDRNNAEPHLAVSRGQQLDDLLVVPPVGVVQGGVAVPVNTASLTINILCENGIKLWGEIRKLI